MRRTLSTILGGFLLCVAYGALSLPASALGRLSPEQLTDEHVRLAIDSIVEELYRRKDANTFWDPAAWTAAHGSKYQTGGYTALVVLSLLHAGQSYQDPRLRDAIEYLEQYEMQGTYAVAMRAHVWAKLPRKYAGNLHADTKWLLDSFSDRVGGWDYSHNPRTMRKDNSLRQYGALGLWEAAKRDVAIETRYWQQLERAFIDNQMKHGGWNYKGDDDAARGSMTAAGLAVLFITQDFLHARESLRIGGGSEQRPRRPHEAAIERGLQWMDANFSPTSNPGFGTHFYYYLYGIERVGLASGYKHFGGRDWFREGTAALIDDLCTWNEESRTMSVNEKRRRDDGGFSGRVRHDDLAFALMFLSRGRVPVAVNKLQGDFAWNNRPRDAANFVRMLTEATEGDLSWQIVSIDSPAVAWLDAPLVYVASHAAWPWIRDAKVDVKSFVRDARRFISDRASGALPPDAPPPLPPEIPQLQRMKEYLDLGGMILAVNEGRSQLFARSVEDAGSLMYPQYEWRDLPADHWAYRIQHRIDRIRPALRGLSNGVRELIIVSARNDVPELLQDRSRVDEPLQHTISNVYYYASEMNRPRARLDRHGDVNTEHASEDSREALIVRALHDGNWKPEPRSLPSFAAWAADSLGIELSIRDVPLVMLLDVETKPALVVVHGIDGVEFTGRQLDMIRRHVEGGGYILFETVGGCGDFANRAEVQMKTLFGTEAVPLIRDGLLTGEGVDGARDVTRVEYRPYSFDRFGVRETTPRLRGMQFDGCWRVLFSSVDLSHAMLDQPCWGISGYSPQSARALLGNILLYALQRTEETQPEAKP